MLSTLMSTVNPATFRVPYTLMVVSMNLVMNAEPLLTVLSCMLGPLIIALPSRGGFKMPLLVAWITRRLFVKRFAASQYNSFILELVKSSLRQMHAMLGLKHSTLLHSKSERGAKFVALLEAVSRVG